MFPNRSHRLQSIQSTGDSYIQWDKIGNEMPEKALKRLRKNEKQWKNEDKNDKLNSKTRKNNKKLTKNQTVPILQRSQSFRH